MAKKGIYHKIVKLCDSNNISWPKEMKMAKKLYNKYPYDEFWENLNLSVNSLCYFLTKEGSYLLDQEYEKYSSFVYNQQVQQKEENYSKDKIEEDKEVKRKIKTIHDLMHHA